MVDQPTPSLRQELREELRPTLLVPSVFAGVANGIIGTSMLASLALLVFSGDLSSHASVGVGMFLTGAVVLNVTVALRGSGGGVFSAAGDGPAAILSVMAASVYRAMSGTSSADEAAATVVGMIVLTTILTGVLFFVLGHIRAGGLVRFIPYPVIGGFLAGMGWLLLRGSIAVMADIPATLSEIPVLVQPSSLARWLPGLIYGAILFTVMRYSKHFLTMPLLLVSGLVLFFAVLWLTATPVAEASAQGWLLEAVPGGQLWQPPKLSSLASIRWPLLLGQWGGIVTLLLVALVQLLLYVSSLELATQKDLDLDQELRSVGIANVLSGCASGMGGYHWPGLSTLAFKIGGSTRTMALVAAGVMVAVLFAGASIVSYFPKPVLAGLLAYLGFAWLIEWVWHGFFKLSKSDYLIVVIILVVIAAIGVLEGVGLGILAAATIFVVKYSGIDVVRNSLTGESLQSNVDRPPSQRDLLRRSGKQMLILKLQGFVFFGTANKLLVRVRRRALDPTLPSLRYAVLDFQRVTGVDSSALMSFVRLRQLAGKRGFTLVLTQLTPNLGHRLEREGLYADEALRTFPTFDHGMEWCENQMLVAENENPLGDTQPLQKLLMERLQSPDAAAILMQYMAKHEVDVGQYVMRQGDSADDLYFLESGWVTVQLEIEDGQTVRLRTMGPGAVIGEIGLYTGGTRSASIMTDQPCTLYRLSLNGLREMESRDPGVASQFHQFMVRLVAERLVSLNDFVRALLE